MKRSATPVRVLVDLSFDSRAALLEAFLRVGAQPSVTSCSLESEGLRLQYVLPREDAPALAERIYLSGGLRWCTGHVLADPAAQGPSGRKP